MAEIRIPVTVDLGNSEGKLKSIQNGITGTGESFVKLKTAIGLAKVGLDQAIEKFGVFSTQAAVAGKALGELNSRAGTINKFSAAFDADAKFRAFSGAIQGGVGAMQGIIGAQALFGIESKDTLETLKKVQGAMAFSQGINSVLEAKDSFVALGAQIKAMFTSTKSAAIGNEVLAVSETTVATATETASASMSGFKMALIATGIGAFVVGLGLLIANWDKISASIGGTNESLKDFKDITKEASKNTGEEIGKLEILYRTSQNQNATYKDRKKAVDELQSLYPSYFGNLKDEEILAGNATTAYDKLKNSIIAKAKSQAAVAKIQDIFSSEEYQKAAKDVDRFNDGLKNAYRTVNGAKLLNVGFTPAIVKDLENGKKAAEQGLQTFDNRVNNIISTFGPGNVVDAVINGKDGGKKAVKTGEETVKQSLDKFKESLRDISALQFDAGLINRFTRISDQIKLSEEELKTLVTKFNLTSSDPLVQGLIKDIEKLKGQITAVPSLFDAIRNTPPISQLFDVKLKGKVEVPDISGDFKDVKEKTQAEIDDLNATLSSSLSSGLGEGLSGIGEAIGTAIANGGNVWEAAGQALIGGLGTLMQTLGKDMIKASILVETAKKSFLTGPAGIVAGVALIALGAILKSQFSKKAAAGFATGGYVSGPGSTKSDSIPAMLSNGEYVINAASVNKFGLGFLNRINSGLGFADGGMASIFTSGSRALVNRTDSRALVNRASVSTGESFSREVPYIASTQISGQDLKLILTRADRRFSNVT